MMSAAPSMIGARRAGFTLIEILIAASIAAALLVAIYGLFGNAMKLRDRATERARVSRLRNRAVTVLRNDLRNALVSGGKIAATLKGSRDGQSSRFPGDLKFTTTTSRDNPADALTDDVQEVEYYVTNDPDANGREGGLLVRTVDRNLLAETPDVPMQESLLAGVSALEISFYDGSTWQDSWEVTDTALTLPQAVRVRIVQAAADNATVLPPLEINVPWLTEAAIVSTEVTVPAGPAAPPAPAP
jgi:type II secretion system protein J